MTPKQFKSTGRDPDTPPPLKRLKAGSSQKTELRDRTNKSSQKSSKDSAPSDPKGKSKVKGSLPSEHFKLRIIVYPIGNQHQRGVLFDWGYMGNRLVDAPLQNDGRRMIRQWRDIPLNTLPITRDRFVANLVPLDISRYYEIVDRQRWRWVVNPLYDDISWCRHLLQDLVDEGLLNIDVDEVINSVSWPPLI